MTALARNLLRWAGPQLRVPRILVSLPFEGRVDVAVECGESERSRLFDYVLADDRRAELIARAFDLADEGGES